MATISASCDEHQHHSSNPALPAPNFVPSHCALRVELDLLRASLSAIATLEGRCAEPAAASFGLHLRGAAVRAVRIDGAPADFRLRDPLAAVASLAPPRRGLEVRSAVEIAARLDNECELTIDLPHPAAAAAGEHAPRLLRVEVEYSITGCNGALAFATAPSGGDGHSSDDGDNDDDAAFAAVAEPLHYAFTKQRPGRAGAVAGHGLGARCIFPCIDELPLAEDSGAAGACTWDLEITVAGADADGVLRSAAGAVLARVEVAASGDAFDSRVTAPLSGGGSSASTRAWRFAVQTPVPPFAIGFVAGPLVLIERLEVHASVLQTLPSAAGLSSARVGATALEPLLPSRPATAVSHFACGARAANGSAALHVRRTRRMLSFFTDWLGCPYPFNAHRHVFLPAGLVLSAPSAVLASPTGLAPPLPEAGDLLHGDAAADCYCMAGLTLLPDSLLTSSRVADPDAACHRAQAHGLVSSWIGCVVRAATWQDLWLPQGLARYLCALYLRSFRGEGDFGLELERLAEATARLEEENPCLFPLHPGRLGTAPAIGSGPAFAIATASPFADSPLAVQHPLRERLLAIKAPAVVHCFTAHVGEARFKQALCTFVARALGNSAASPSAAVPSLSASLSSSLTMPRASSGPAEDSGRLSTASFLSAMKLAGGGGPRSAALVDSIATRWVYGRGVPLLVIGVDYRSEGNRVLLTVEQVLRPGGRIFCGELIVHVVEKADRAATEASANGTVVGGEAETGPGAPASVATAAGTGAAPPETWQHSVLVRHVRETFSLPCHSRMERAAGEQWGDHGTRLSRKRGRRMRKSRARPLESVAPTAVGVAAAASADSGTLALAADPDEENRTPVEWVRIDPMRGWLRRLRLCVPPCMAVAQLCREPAQALAMQLEAMRALAGQLCGDALPVPGVGLAALPPLGAFPPAAAFSRIDKPQNALWPEVVAALRADTTTALRSSAAALGRVGFQPRPTLPLTPLFRLAAVVAGFDPALARAPASAAAAAALAAAAASATNAAAAAPVSARRHGPGNGAEDAQAHAPSAVAAPTLFSTPVFGDRDWRVRVAAAFCIARWQSGRLPGYGKSATQGFEQTYAGLAALIALYQRFFYAEPAALALAGTGTLSAPSSSPLTILGLTALLASLGSACASEDAVLALASGGTPGPLAGAALSLGQLQLRRALLEAIGAVRHPDGLAPDAAVAFLTRSLVSHDAHVCISRLDDSAFVACLARTLGACLLDCDGARRVMRVLRDHPATPSQVELGLQPPGAAADECWAAFLPREASGSLDYESVRLFREGWQCLREQLAVELTALRYGGSAAPFKASSATAAAASSVRVGVRPGLAAAYAHTHAHAHAGAGAASAASFAASARDWVTCGTAAAASLSALASLEARLCVPPVAAAPLLRAYVRAQHPLTGRDVPPRLRLAAFAGLARLLLLTLPFAAPRGHAAPAALAPAAAASDVEMATASSSSLPSSTSMSAARAPVSAAWFSSVRALLDEVLCEARSAGGAGGLAEAMLGVLLTLQSRTDREAHEGVGAGSSGGGGFGAEGQGGSASGFASDDKRLVARLRADLGRAIKERPRAWDLYGALLVAGKNAGVGASSGAVERAAPAPSAESTVFFTRWTFAEAAVDLGLLDCLSHGGADDSQGQGAAALCLQERRIYGALRLAPAFRGCLSPLAAGIAGQEDAEAASNALWALLSPRGLGPDEGGLACAAYHLQHAVFGMAPQRLYYARAGSPGPAATEAEAEAPAAEVIRFADARRDAIQLLRSSARATHLAAALAFGHAKSVQLQTGTFARFGEEGMDGADAGGGEEGGEEGEGEEGEEEEEEEEEEESEATSGGDAAGADEKDYSIAPSAPEFAPQVFGVSMLA